MINTERFQLTQDHQAGSFNALTDVISCVNVYIHKLNDDYVLKKRISSKLSVFFVVEGSVSYCQKLLETNTTFIPKREEVATFSSKSATLLEISLNLNTSELESVDKKLPMTIRYSEARTYKEDCKSEKTTSRMILEDGVIPRFALGSVETTGPDKVSEHTHPNVDQFFFSLPNSNSFLTVSEESLPFPEKTVMHIPLGSSHGVRVEDKNIMHYLWCDFYLDETTSDYIKSAHKFI